VAGILAEQFWDVVPEQVAKDGDNHKHDQEHSHVRALIRILFHVRASLLRLFPSYDQGSKESGTERAPELALVNLFHCDHKAQGCQCKRSGV
jgi:hypothetical protein